MSRPFSYPDDDQPSRPGTIQYSGDPEDPLRRTLGDALQHSPDQAAKILKLQDRTGLPPALIERHADELEKTVAAKDFDAAKFRKESPMVAQWLMEHPQHAAIAQDDLWPLQGLEKLIDVGRSLAAGIPQFIGSATAGAGTLIDIGARGIFRATDQGPISIGLQEAGQAWKDIGQFWIAPPASRQNIATEIAGSVGQMGGQIAEALLAPELVLPSLMAQGADTAADRAKQAGKEDTRGAAAAEVAGAAVMGIIGKYGLEKLIERVPPQIQNAVLKRLTDVVLAGGYQAGLQVVQDTLNNVATRLAIDPKQPIIGDLTNQAIVGGATGAIARGILGVAVPDLAKHLQRIEQAKQSRAFFEALGSGVQQSKTFERLPQKLQELVLRMTKDGPIENTYLPVEDIRTYAQSLNQDPGDFLESITPGGKAKWAEASAAGADVQVPLHDYATKIAPTDAAKHFNEAVRLGDPEAMNAREAQQFTEAQKRGVSPNIQKSDLERSAEKVREDILGQMTGMGFRPAAVSAYARMYEQVFRAIGERSGQDPFALYEPYQLKITRPLPDVLAKLPDADTHLDPLIDQLRAGKQPTQSEMFGTSLLDFIREKGGVKDEGGDLASREIDKERKPFQKRILNNETGLPADTMREAAAEAGYIDKQSSINDFLDAIDKEVRGEPVYAQGQERPGAIEQSIVLEQLDSYLKSRDIDVKSATNVEIKAALKAAASEGKAGDIDARTGQVLDQKFDLDKRGDIVFGPDRKMSIRLLENADLSTFVHESGHFFLEVVGDVVAELRTRSEALNDTQKRMVDDYDQLLSHLGVSGRNAIGTEQHETFARSFEAYLREGKAPSPELRTIFQRFKGWLTQIYKSLTQLNVTLTPEVRGIFDRLLATDTEIERAEKDAQIRGMIEDQGQAERLGLSPEEFRAYGDTVRQARDNAKDDLFDEYMDEYGERQAEWYARRRDETRAEVAAEVHSQRDYMVLSFLKDGTLPDGSPLPEGFEGRKLDAAALEERYKGKAVRKDLRTNENPGSAVLNKLLDLRLYGREGGIDPDQAARDFGYSSGDEMVQALLKLRPMDELIEAETTDRMRQSYGDMLTDGSASEKARDAVMTNGRAKVIEQEMKALAKKVRETAPFRNLGASQARAADRQARAAGMTDLRRSVPSVSLARDIAQSRIADMKLRDVKAGLYFAAARREGNAAIDAVNRGDFQQALTHKQQELVNVAMYEAARDVAQEVQKTRDYMLGFDKAETRGRIGKAGGDYLDQIDKLLDRYSFSNKTLKAVDQMKSLQDFIKSEAEQGHELDIPLELQNEAGRKNYRDMTVAELRGLKDAVKSIEHWANFKNKLLRNQAKRELDQLGADGVVSIDGNSRGPRKMSLEMRLPGSQKPRTLQSFFLAHLPLGSILREMDGFKDGGFLFENVMRPIDEAGHNEAVRLEQATSAVMDLYRNAYKGEESQLWEKQFIPEINDSLTKWGRLMVALNWGNDGNRQRVMSGFRWDEGQVGAVLNTLEQRDWTFVQGVWDHIDSYWGEIAAKQKRVTGVAPEKVEASPIQTKFGEIKGGYFPIVYEGRLTARAAANPEASFAKLIEQSSYTKATTARGHTEARMKKVEMPVRLDPGVITEHLQQVIHDLTHHEMLIDVGRLLGRKDIQDAIYRNHGDVAYSEIKSHVRDVALGSTPAPSWYRTYAALRSNAVTARLGWNAVTALIHVPNITSGMVRVGPQWVMQGVVDALSSAKGAEHSAQWVAEQSDMMRLRWKHRMVELSEFRDEIGLNRGKLSSEIRDAAEKIGIDPETAHHFKDSYLYAIHRILQFAEIPTWVGAYEKAISGGREPADARAMADRAILDSIGGGQMKDVASVQKGAIGKIFTTFMTYQLSMHRLGREVLLKNESGLRKAVDATLLVMVPMAFVTAVHHFARPQKKEEGFGHALLNEGFDHAVGMFVGARELQGALQKPDYQGPASFGVFGSLKQAVFRVEQGKSAAAVAKATNEAAGELFGYPAHQVDRTIEGVLALMEGKTKNLSSVLFGPPATK